MPDLDFGDDNTIQEDDYVIGEFFHNKGSKISYNYDFGDEWEHKIICKKLLSRKERDVVKPKVIAGEKACPPEDCGGFLGYENILEVISNPNDEEYGSIMEWLGGKFDPDEFNLNLVNLKVAEEFGG